MTLRRVSTALVIGGVALLGMGCFERPLNPVNPCTRSNVSDRIQVNSVDEVDLLFMIDNSNSMREEQTQLRAELPRLVRVLASGDYMDDDPNTVNFAPVKSLHIGIITSDMGSGGFSLCNTGRSGDDGILLADARVADPACTAPSYPPVFEFVSAGGNATTFAAQVSCVANVGTGGCGLEQQLEAALKAVSPSSPQPWTIPTYEPPEFFDGTLGHGGLGDFNEGFVRANSALAIILVTDEEDCSTRDPEFYNNAGPFGSAPPNLRCWRFGEDMAGGDTPLTPVRRYIDGENGTAGFLGLRRNPNLLIFAAIVGVPPGYGPDAMGRINYQAILDDPDMEERESANVTNQLEYSCRENLVSDAFPPRRIVRVAQGLDAENAGATVQTICQQSYSGALSLIIEKIAAALGGACLPRVLNPDPAGFVGCTVFEVLPFDSGEDCELEGREDAGTIIVDGQERTACEVKQVGVTGQQAGESGWYYESATTPAPGSDIAMACPGGQRIRFNELNPRMNSEVRLECLQTIQPAQGASTRDVIGDFCGPPIGSTQLRTCNGDSPLGENDLGCDPSTRQCGVPCEATSDCTAAGLLGDVCDTRTYADAAGANDPNISDSARARIIANLEAARIDPEGDIHAFCVNPTCI